MTHLILVRHGQTDWNKDGRLQGRLDIPLNAEGRKQIQHILSGLVNLKGVKKIDAVYCSQLSRSVETAAEIGRVYGLKVNSTAGLNELNFGVWQGLLERQIGIRYKKLYNIWKETPLFTAPPRGETIKDAHTRILAALRPIIKRYNGQVACIVAHGIVLAIIKCHYKRIDLNRIWDNVAQNATVELLAIKKE